MTIFSGEEMARRVQWLRTGMERFELDCIIATSYPAFYYLSGVPIHCFGRPIAVVIPLEGEATIVESVIEIEHTRAHTWIEDVRVYYDYNVGPIYTEPQRPLDSLIALLRAVATERGIATGRVGLEAAHLPAAHYWQLTHAFPDAALVDASALLTQVRMVLSDEELALVRGADAVANLGQERLIQLIQPGKPAVELVEEVRTAMIHEIGRIHPDKPFHLHVDTGLGDTAKGAGHSEWALWNEDDRVATGQVLTTGISVWLWGYWGNVERTVYVGAPDDTVRRAFDIMVEANEAAISRLGPDIPLAEVDLAAKAVLARHGYTTRTGSGCGRGIVSYEGNARELGMDLRLYSDAVLTPGMAFSLEPDLLEPGRGTFRHCNTIIITTDGYEIDSYLPRGPIFR